MQETIKTEKHNYLIEYTDLSYSSKVYREQPDSAFLLLGEYYLDLEEEFQSLEEQIVEQIESLE